LTGTGHARHRGAEVTPAKWGEYEPAIRRWEAVTRPAPEPTKLNSKGNPKLSDIFDEWLMGFPAGWATDVPGVTWNEALKAYGNGVVPQQGIAAICFLIDSGRRFLIGAGRST
jgi:DNA (cytosine-5)-methyltransferase 1